jgi:hypothetical protein
VFVVALVRLLFVMQAADEAVATSQTRPQNKSRVHPKQAKSTSSPSLFHPETHTPSSNTTFVFFQDSPSSGSLLLHALARISTNKILPHQTHRNKMHSRVVAVGLMAGLAAVSRAQARMYIQSFPSSAHC